MSMSFGDVVIQINNDPKPPHEDLKKVLRTGSIAAGLLIFGFGGWAALSQLGGAVVAGGTVIVQSFDKKVQHLSGGAIDQIYVKDGDHVSESQILLHLDETVLRANLSSVTKQLDELIIRQARLEAERDGLDEPIYPDSVASRQNDAAISKSISAETRFFTERKTSTESRRSQLASRIDQLQQEISGFEAQIASREKEKALISKEFEGVKILFDRHLVSINRYITLQRDKQHIDGELGELKSQIAQAQGKISETRIQLVGIDQDFRSDVMKDLREVQSKIADLSEKAVSAADQLKHATIRAPQSGVVYQLTAHTIGGVVAPGETIMSIVPENDSLVIDAKIAPQDIDAVHLGQQAFVKFPAFNQRTTPEVSGEITMIAADLTKDRDTPQSQPYYSARITLSEEERNKLGEVTLLPGMPAEIHVKTIDRSVLSYLIKPLQDQIAHTFREK